MSLKNIIILKKEQQEIPIVKKYKTGIADIIPSI